MTAADIAARRAARGMADPLNRLRAYNATCKPVTAVDAPRYQILATGYQFRRAPVATFDREAAAVAVCVNLQIANPDIAYQIRESAP